MLRIHDTLTRRLREVTPGPDGIVRFYCCGPTVHDHAHVGNWRTFTVQDVARRVMRQRGLDVRMVMNITDVEDKIIRRAQEAGIDVTDPARLIEYTGPFEEAFHEDREALRILPADEYPHATAHVPEMIELVKRLMERGHAYEAGGSVYFRVESFSDYGKLAHLDAAEIQPGARVDSDEYEKGNVRDFVLWKGWKEGEPIWDSPWGRGRPGWHLECSVMSMHCLASETIDLHGGGEDLVFPHHENEIAQSEGATGNPFCRSWMHCAHLRVDGQKMAKSLGNFFTLRDLVAKGHDAVAVRYFLASVHYRAPVNLTEDGLEAAAAAVERLVEFGRRLAAARPATADDEALLELVERSRREFDETLDDDLNTSGALGTLFGVVREVNPALERGQAGQRVIELSRDLLARADEVFAFLPIGGVAARKVTREVAGQPYEVTALADVPDDVIDRVVGRQEARKAKDFGEADRLRDELLAEGWTVEDVPGGARIKRH